MAVTTTTGVVTSVTWSTTDKNNITLSAGNLTAISTASVSGWQTRARASKGYRSGKYYAEYTIVANSGTGTGNMAIGIANTSQSDFIGNVAANGYGIYPLNGGYSDFATSGNAVGAGSILCIAYDFDNMKMWTRTNGGNWCNDILANQNPATNTGGKSFSAVTGIMYPIVEMNDTVPNVTANFGASNWAQTPPNKFFGFSRTDTLVVITNGTTSYTLPSDYDVNFNQWHTIGAGGGMSQGTPNVQVDGSAGGGAFSIKSGVSGTPGSTVVTLAVGLGGTAGATHASNGTAGGDTWASTNGADTTIAGGSVFVGAKGGATGNRGGAAGGGASGSGVGDGKFSGGNSGNSGAAGGGGAAGQLGPGAVGGLAATATNIVAGGGGGGPNGGTAGAAGSGTTGGNGGADGLSGTGGGTGGVSGSNGADGTTGAGAGAGWTTGGGSTHGGNGGTDQDYDSTHGPGGGGGGSGGGGNSGVDNTQAPASGGNYGGGAGSGWAGDTASAGHGIGGDGLLVLRYYTPSVGAAPPPPAAANMFMM